MDNLSILVVSCDAYSDLWDPFFKLFNQFWADCPYSVYLQTNIKNYPSDAVKTIQVGKDIDWSSNLITALDAIPTQHVLLLLEDFFLCQPVDTHRIKMLHDFISKRQAGYCRLVPKPPSDNMIHSKLNIGLIKPGENYRMSFQAGIWDRDILKQLLKAGENAWQAEMEGSRRSDQLTCDFLSVCKEDFNQWPLLYLNAVIKRKYTPEAVKFCVKNAVTLNLSAREVCSWYDQLRRKRFFRKTVSLMIRITRYLLGERFYAAMKNNVILRKVIY